MRRSRPGSHGAELVTAALLLFLVAGCGAPAGSGPPGSPPPSSRSSAAPTAVPDAVAWSWQAPLGPIVVTGPDGAVYATGRAGTCEVAVHALDTSGDERADGWPWCAEGARSLDFLSVDDGGAVYAGGAHPAGITGLAADGTPGPGWPAPFGFLAGTLQSGLVVATPSPDGPSELRAHGPDGDLLPGWPVRLPGAIVDPAMVGPDDGVAALYRDPATGRRWVTVVERTGAVRAGWPVPVPNEMDGASVVIDVVTSDGRVVLRSHEPWPLTDRIEAMVGLRGQVAVIRADGTIPAGWPTRFEQPLSPLVEAPGGRLVAIAGDVQYGRAPDLREPVGPYAVISLETDGSASPGWPAALPDGAMPLPADVAAGPVAPWALPPVVAADGSVLVVARWADAEEGLVWLERDGSLALAQRLPGSSAISRGAPATPGGPAILPVTIGTRAFLAVGIAGRGARAVGPAAASVVDAPATGATIAAVLAGTGGGGPDAVLAVERSGAVAGWPVLLPGRSYVGGMLAAPDGTLLVVGTGVGDDSTLLALGPEVTLAGP